MADSQTLDAARPRLVTEYIEKLIQQVFVQAMACLQAGPTHLAIGCSHDVAIRQAVLNAFTFPLVVAYFRDGEEQPVHLTALPLNANVVMGNSDDGAQWMRLERGIDPQILRVFLRPDLIDIGCPAPAQPADSTPPASGLTNVE